MSFNSETDGPLYVVKREHIPVYETGHHSHAVPKLYKIGDAKKRVKQNNNRLQSYLNSDSFKSGDTHWAPDSPHRLYCLENYGQEWVDSILEAREKSKWEALNGGPWIMVEVILKEV